jgi:hypothetical protein
MVAMPGLDPGIHDETPQAHQYCVACAAAIDLTGPDCVDDVSEQAAAVCPD